MDNLTRDIEVTGVKALLLARGACLLHGQIEAALQEKLTASKK